MKLQGKFRLISLLAIFCAVLLAGPVALAKPLDDAKAAGFIKETPDGYVVAVAKAPKQVKALADNVNLRRKAAYEKIAARTGATVEQVGHESYQRRHPKKK